MLFSNRVSVNPKGGKRGGGGARNRGGQEVPQHEGEPEMRYPENEGEPEIGYPENEGGPEIGYPENEGGPEIGVARRYPKTKGDQKQVPPKRGGTRNRGGQKALPKRRGTRNIQRNLVARKTRGYQK